MDRVLHSTLVYHDSFKLSPRLEETGAFVLLGVRLSEAKQRAEVKYIFKEMKM